MHKKVATHLSLAASILAVGSLCCLPSCAPSSPTGPANTGPANTGPANNTTQAIPVPDNAPLPLDPPSAVPADSETEPSESLSIEDPPSETGKQVAGTTDKTVAPPRARPPIRRAATGELTDITFDDLKLEMPIGTLFDRTMLTPRVEELDGQNVRLRGFIFAGGVFQPNGIKSFPFVMNTQCKFGPQGLAYCVILVELKEGVTTDFTTYPITVEGRLSVQPYNAGGFTWSVYHMQGTKVF